MIIKLSRIKNDILIRLLDHRLLLAYQRITDLTTGASVQKSCSITVFLYFGDCLLIKEKSRYHRIIYGVKNKLALSFLFILLFLKSILLEFLVHTTSQHHMLLQQYAPDLFGENHCQQLWFHGLCNYRHQQ